MMTTGTPKVSCLMPTCDRPAWAARAAEYFHAQDYAGELELVVVDDGATTNRVEQLGQLDRVVYHRCNPATLGAKRRIAIELATGDLLAHWDDDDYHGPGRIRRQVAALGDKGICLLRPVPFYELATERTVMCIVNCDGTSLFSRRYYESGPPIRDLQVGSFNEIIGDRPESERVYIPAERDYVAIRHGSNNTAFRVPAPMFVEATIDAREIIAASGCA